MLGEIDVNIFCSYFRDMVCGGKLSLKQKEGIENIFTYAIQHYPDLSDAKFSYILATAYHETGRSFQPIKEAGSTAYLKSKPYYPYIGAGLIQVTWEENYKKFGASNTEDLLTWPIALDCLFRGMMDGLFTGKKLGDFMEGEGSLDVFDKARAVVNGRDRAALVSGYAMSILKCLSESISNKENPSPYSSCPVTDVDMKKNPAIITAATTAAGGTIAAVSNVQSIVSNVLHSSRDNIDGFKGIYQSLGDSALWIVFAAVLVCTSVVLILEIKNKSENGGW